MCNRERISMMRRWKEMLINEDANANRAKIECLSYAIKQCDKNESQREVNYMTVIRFNGTLAVSRNKIDYLELLENKCTNEYNIILNYAGGKSTIIYKSDSEDTAKFMFQMYASLTASEANGVVSITNSDLEWFNNLMQRYYKELDASTKLTDINAVFKKAELVDKYNTLISEFISEKVC